MSRSSIIWLAGLVGIGILASSVTPANHTDRGVLRYNCFQLCPIQATTN